MIALKLLALVCLAAAATITSLVLVTRADSAPNRLVRSYIIHLDARLYELQKPPLGARIAAGQALALVLVLLVIAAKGPNPWLLVLLALVGAAPQLFLMREMKKRRLDIELQLNGFNLALANALRASPSLGKALKRAEDVATGPMAEELGIVLRELRLGATVDQALLNLASRVGSVSLDAIITSLLIGRQIGGRIPDILETTASTLREMERLEGVIRTKTSEAKGQLWLMALAPPVIFVIFDNLQPGYFNPLTESFGGFVVLGGAVLAWAASIILARRILALEI